MGRKGYGTDIKLQAKAMWVTGRGTDAEIAELLGIQRPETVADWRRTEGWDRERQYIKKLTDVTRQIILPKIPPNIPQSPCHKKPAG